jgi:hypothetical protein
VTLPTKERVVPTLHNIPYCWSSWALFAHGLNILGWSNEIRKKKKNYVCMGLKKTTIRDVKKAGDIILFIYLFLFLFFTFRNDTLTF